MKFEESFDFDHDVDTVLRMFTDREYFVAKYRRMGGREPEIVSCDDGDDHFSITVRHALDMDQMSFPDFLKKRVGDRLTLRQTDTWTPSKAAGRIDIDIEKMPVNISIALHLGQRSGGSRLQLGFDIKADVPLLGGKIEKAIAAPITRRMHTDLRISRKMAADYVPGAA